MKYPFEGGAAGICTHVQNIALFEEDVGAGQRHDGERLATNMQGTGLMLLCSRIWRGRMAGGRRRTSEPKRSAEKIHRTS